MTHYILRMGPCMAAAALTSAAAAQVCKPGWEVHPTGPNFVSYVMMPYDEGHRTSLFVGGNFAYAGGIPTGPIARWDGTSWSPVGSIYLQNRVQTMLVYDEGLGSSLYVGGRFLPSGGFDAKGVARWDGTAWHPASAGLELLENGVLTLVVHDAGGGPAIYAGGFFWFTEHGFNGPRYFARWNGQLWEPVGGGVFGPLQTLVSHDDGTGPMLYGYGYVLPGSGGLIITLGRWDGQAWHDLRGSWEGGTGDLIKYRNGAGDRILYYGGLSDHNGQVTRGVFVWSDDDWVPIGITNSSPLVSTVWDDGSGPALYIAGHFSTVNGASMPRVASWNGVTWRGAGFVPGSDISVLGGFTDDLGHVLYAGGTFPNSPNPHLRFAEYRTCYDVELCYANCDGSTSEPILNVEDFMCFINEFALAHSLPYEQQVASYANCDNSTTAPVLNFDDFTCFINKFAAGCP